MQYDLAHARGGIPDKDLRIETWKVERRKKEVQRIRGQRAADEHERMEEAVDIMPPPSPALVPTADLEGKTPVQESEFDDFQDAAENLDDNGDVKPRAGRVMTGNGSKKRLAFQNKPHIILSTSTAAHDARPGEVEPRDEQQTEEAQETRVDSENAPEHTESHKKKDRDDEEDDREKQKHGRRHERHHSDADLDEDLSESSFDEDDYDDRYERWNAVCVICLRVYSKDPSLSILLVKPGLVEETSSLVQGGEPAGATM